MHYLPVRYARPVVHLDMHDQVERSPQASWVHTLTIQHDGKTCNVNGKSGVLGLHSQLHTQSN